MDEQNIQDYFNFLAEVLQITQDSKGDRRAVYPLLQANLDKLNLNLIEVLEVFATLIIPDMASDNVYSIARDIVVFSHLISEFSEGDEATKLEIAIKGYKIGLTFHTADIYTQQWASTQWLLGNAYVQRIVGNKADNIELAINAYQQALQVDTPDASAEYWARVQADLGNAYLQKTRGNKADSVELAIEAYQQALQAYTRETSPEDWAGIQINLGIAYSDRIKGDKSENIELAIQMYQKALEVFIRDTFPKDWAGIQSNLGNAYCDRIKGDKAENIELSISAHQQALQIYTYNAFPCEWARTQNNLGDAYAERIEGKKANNLELAIAAYQQALQVRTREAFPDDWAQTTNNIGIAYYNRIAGDKAENIELAIAAYQEALQVHTRDTFPWDWAKAQNNLGNAYLIRIMGDKTENIELAIAVHTKALQVRTREASPGDWAQTQNNLGNVYCYRIKGNKSNNIKLAIKAYQKALQVYTAPTNPIECLRTARNLGNLGFKERNWQLGVEGYTMAIQSVETARNWASTDENRQGILASFIDVYANIIQCFVNLQQYDKAVEYADRSRSRLLVELMASKDLYPDAETPPEIEEYLQLQRQLDRLRELSKSPYHQDDAGKLQEQKIKKIEELERRLQELWRQIRKRDPVLAGQLQVDPLTIQQIQQLIENEQTAILSFYTTWEHTYIFVLRQNSTTLHTCQGQGIETLQLWVRQNWLIPYLSNRQQWRDNIGPFLSELAQRLQLPQLIDERLADIEELVIIPHLFLHQIPFAALPIANSIPTADSDSATDATRGMTFSGKRPPAKKPKPAPAPKPTYLSEKYRLRVIPSCQILSYCHENEKKKKNPLSPKMGIVENATNDLPFSGYECQAIAKIYGVPETLHLRGDRATPTNYRDLAQKVQLLHSSHHAEADLNDPLNSKLDLAGGEVTLGEIFTWRLPNLVEVFLACCETNFTPQTTPADDILVIAAGWLSAGALNVVSTLWAVDDCATAVFSILYYRQRRQQPTLKRSEALRRAQFQLRGLTRKEFNTEYRDLLEECLAQKETKKNQEIVKRARASLERCSQEPYPFESPLYWAPFVSQGMN